MIFLSPRQYIKHSFIFIHIHQNNKTNSQIHGNCPRRIKMISLYKSYNAQWFLRLTICKKKNFKNDINQKAKVKIIEDVVLKFLKANGNVFLKTVFQWSFISCFTVYFNLFRENQMYFDFAYLSRYKYIILLSFQYRHTIRHHIIHTIYVNNNSFETSLKTFTKCEYLYVDILIWTGLALLRVFLILL